MSNASRSFVHGPAYRRAVTKLVQQLEDAVISLHNARALAERPDSWRLAEESIRQTGHRVEKIRARLLRTVGAVTTEPNA